MGTNCAPLLADLFLYSYENEFLDNMIRSGHRRLARSFNLCYRYIDDLIVFNNKKFLDYLKEINPSQLTVEKANKSDHLADYLDLTFIIDSGGKLSTRLYDKRDDFDFHIVNFPFLSSNIPSGPSYTKLFSISFPQLRSLQKLALESTNFDYSSAEYRVIAIILDIANYRLFRPVRSDVPAEKPKHFMKIKFLNKAVDAINLPALLRSTSVTDKIPVYFRDKEPPIVSYEYTSTVASKLFNFAPTLSNLNVSEYLSNSQTCQCKKSKFCYEPHGHVITGDLRVIENAKLRELVAKGPKYREPNRVNWKAIETMFLESIDLYAKKLVQKRTSRTQISL